SHACLFIYIRYLFYFFHCQPPPAGASRTTSSPSLSRICLPAGFPFTRRTRSFASFFIIFGIIPSSSSAVVPSLVNVLPLAFSRATPYVFPSTIIHLRFRVFSHPDCP